MKDNVRTFAVTWMTSKNIGGRRMDIRSVKSEAGQACWRKKTSTVKYCRIANRYDASDFSYKKSIRNIPRYDPAKSEGKEASDKVRKKMFGRRRRSRHHSITTGSDQTTRYGQARQMMSIRG
jgi:hypothetical protein